MANQWLRLWHDMPTDPKWRTIARVSGERIGDVMAVYVHILVCASNATERGRTQSFNCEDVANALDIQTEQVEKIVEAMQGRVLDGDAVAGWEKRQVAREDGAAERAKVWREEQKARKTAELNAAERNRTQPNAEQTQTNARLEEKRREEKKSKEIDGAEAPSTTKRGTRLPEGWTLPKVWGEWALAEFPRWTDTTVRTEASVFADYWHSKTGKDATKLDWLATWRMWCTKARAPVGLKAGGAGPVMDNAAKNAEAARLLFGNTQHDTETIDAST